MDELVLVLSDIAVDDRDGSLLSPDTGGDLGTLFGREGGRILVNGRGRPTIRARNGVPLRLRVVNAAIARYFQLAIDGHRFTIVGGDRGIFPSARESAAPVVLPGQRRDLVLVPRGADGQTLTLRWLPYDRGYGSTEFRDPEDVLGIELVGDPVDVPAPAFPPRTVEPLPTETVTSFDVSLTQESVGGELRMGFDGVPSWEAAPVPARIGETQVWTFRNTMEWSHPIHLHGYFFQPIDGAGRPIPEWHDTIDVPVDGVSRFIVRYDDRPGMWMLHCHILDHADAGMMGMIEVAAGTATHAH
jgi:FtsP/CotA-like multicopper oxidase with cupredoxin domain